MSLYGEANDLWHEARLRDAETMAVYDAASNAFASVKAGTPECHDLALWYYAALYRLAKAGLTYFPCFEAKRLFEGWLSEGRKAC